VSRAPLLIVLLLVCAGVRADVDVRSIVWDQHIGARLPLDLAFQDEHRRTLRLGELFWTKPVVLVFSYFNCASLCPEVLSGVREALRSAGLRAEDDYRLVIVSIDPNDDAAEGAASWRTVSHGGTAAHFLSSKDNAVAQLAAAAGFRYLCGASRQFAHPAGFLIANSGGVIAQYFFGVRFSPQAVRAGLLAAGRGELAQAADRLLLLCYHFDPRRGRYSVNVMWLLRLIGGLTALVLAVLWWKQGRAA
jgi:protein SCO1